MASQGNRVFEFTSLLGLKNVTAAFSVLTLYLTTKVIYRLYLSPLSHIPGSKLAGMSVVSFAGEMFH